MDFEQLINQEPEASPPAVQEPRELTPQESLKQWAEAVKGLITEALTVKVSDDASKIKATDLGIKAKKVFKDVDAARDRFVRPLNEQVRAINQTAKLVTEPLKEAETHLKAQIDGYVWKLELERRKAQEEARKAQIALQAQVDAEAAAANIQAPVVPEPVVAPVQTTVRTEAGTGFQKMVWTFEVEDPQAVPREYLMINDMAIRQAVKNGIRQIAGVKIYEKPQTSFR